MTYGPTHAQCIRPNCRYIRLGTHVIEQTIYPRTFSASEIVKGPWKSLGITGRVSSSSFVSGDHVQANCRRQKYEHSNEYFLALFG